MALAKWILTGLGWAFGGPIGALLGYILGSKFSSDSFKRLDQGDNFGDTVRRGPYRNTGTASDINASLMVLMAAVMKADGEVRRSELDYVKAFLRQNYGEDKAVELLKILRDLVKQDIPVADVCSQIKVNTDYSTRYHILDFLFGLGAADGSLDGTEQTVLHRISGYLGINSGDYRSIYSRHATNSYGSGSSASNPDMRGRDPYAVLGISSSATDDEVRKAYRRLAMKYHPDKVEGLSDEVKRNSEAQFRAINEAYEQIKKKRNMK